MITIKITGPRGEGSTTTAAAIVKMLRDAGQSVRYVGNDRHEERQVQRLLSNPGALHRAMSEPREVVVLDHETERPRPKPRLIGVPPGVDIATAQALLDSAEPEPAPDVRVIDCPNCNRKLVLVDGDATCTCGYEPVADVPTDFDKLGVQLRETVCMHCGETLSKCGGQCLRADVPTVIQPAGE